MTKQCQRKTRFLDKLQIQRQPLVIWIVWTYALAKLPKQLFREFFFIIAVMNPTTRNPWDPSMMKRSHSVRVIQIVWQSMMKLTHPNLMRMDPLLANMVARRKVKKKWNPMQRPRQRYQHLYNSATQHLVYVVFSCEPIPWYYLCVEKLIPDPLYALKTMTL